MSATYSRKTPSERYLGLISLYQQMHRQAYHSPAGNAPRVFTGVSLITQAGRIKKLIEETGALSILDYGCGKGEQYSRAVQIPDVPGEQWIVDFWQVDSVACYDPGHEPYSALPQGTFDGVVCTDVLEHCPEQDLPWIVGDLFGYARKFVFANVACYPAKKMLPNGENAHCTLHPPEWWHQLFVQAARNHPGLRWELWARSVGDDVITDNQYCGRSPNP